MLDARKRHQKRDSQPQKCGGRQCDFTGNMPSYPGWDRKYGETHWNGSSTVWCFGVTKTVLGESDGDEVETWEGDIFDIGGVHIGSESCFGE